MNASTRRSPCPSAAAPRRRSLGPLLLDLALLSLDIIVQVKLAMA
jgi:hypothetical protein